MLLGRARRVRRKESSPRGTEVSKAGQGHEWRQEPRDAECGEGRPGAVRGASPTLGPCREGCCAPRRGGGQGPAQAHATRAVLRQVLYRKSMQALDLLLRTFISENKSMDEVCFLLQVRAGLRRLRRRGAPSVSQGALGVGPWCAGSPTP